MQYSYVVRLLKIILDDIIVIDVIHNKYALCVVFYEKLL